MDAGLKRELEEKVLAGQRLSFEDGVALYAADDLAWLGELAHHVRTVKNGERGMSPFSAEYQARTPKRKVVAYPV